MARKQRVVAQLPVPRSQAVQICQRALLERGCEIQLVTEDRIKGRVPGTVLRKYVSYELELASAAGGETTVEIAAWTSNLFSTPNDLVGQAARELQETILYASGAH